MSSNRKILSLLGMFSEEEIKQFTLFISSPYFNKLKNICRLFDILKKYHPLYDSPHISNENIFRKLFPEEKFNDSRIRSLFSYLYSLAGKFLAAESYFSNGNRLNIEIIRGHRNKNHTAYLNKSISNVFNSILKEKIRDHDHYEELYLLQYEKNHLGSYFKPERDFPVESDVLTASYLVKMLKLYATIYNIKSSLDISVDEELINRIESIAQMPVFSKTPAVKMNYLLYRVTRYFDEKAFSEFTSNTALQLSSYKPEDLYQAYILLVNFCVIMIREGNSRYIRQKFELYQNITDKKLWQHEKYISYVIFNNIVTSANENKEFSYALNFIKENSQIIEPDMRENITHFCYAKTYYSLKEYDKALAHLAKTGGMDDLFYKFAVKDLTIKIFCETGQYEPVTSIIDSYRHLITKSRIITLNVKQSYRIYLNFLSEIIKSENKKTLEEIKNRLINSPGFANKEWLIKTVS